jgi:diguanylate cyclase (GGDEF)-like protein
MVFSLFFPLISLLLAQALPMTGDRAAIEEKVKRSKELSESSAPQAKELAQQAMDAARLLQDDYLYASASHALAVAERKLGRYDLAENAVRQALGYFRKTRAVGAWAEALNTLGLLQSDQGAFVQALESQLEALELRRSIGDRQGMAFSYNNLGNIYRNTGDFEKAIDYLELSLELKRESGDAVSISHGYNNLGNIYRRMGRLAEARQNYQQALTVLQQNGQVSATAGPLKNLGTLLEEEGDLAGAMVHYRAAYAIRREQGDKRNQAGILNNIGRIQTALGQPEAALSTLQEALALGREVEARVIFCETYGLISAAHEAEGDWLKALESFKIHSEEYRSLFNEANSARLMELQTRFETKEKEQEIHFLGEMAEAKSHQAFLQRLFLTTVVLALLIVLAVVIGRYRSVHRVKTRLQLLSEELDKKSRDLERLATSDALTGLANRRFFDATLVSEWKSCIRANQPISLLMIDVDHFKVFNDSFGHQEGDECLRKVGEILRSALTRSDDFLCRYGGEEFAALLNFTDDRGAWIVAENMLQAMEKAQIPQAANLNRKFVTVSIGLATIWRPIQFKAEDLLRAADEALYRAKAKGRFCIESTCLTSAQVPNSDPEPGGDSAPPYRAAEPTD